MNESHDPPFVLVPNDEVSQYAAEFSLLCDRLNVCEEIREGYYSDEARVCDLFDTLASNDEMESQVAALDLPGISPDSYLLHALQVVRQHWSKH